MAAIVYFTKSRETDDFVTYRYGLDEDNPKHSFSISKVDRRPTDDPEKATFAAQLAFRAISRGYEKLGMWPEQGAGYA